MSKIPPEFRQAALERAGVDRQEVSDSFVFHKVMRLMGERDGGQLICGLGGGGVVFLEGDGDWLLAFSRRGRAEVVC